MPDPKNITETTTLSDLRDQLLLLEVLALRVQSALEGADAEPLEASLHHATGFYKGKGPTLATAIEAAFVELRRALLPEPLKQYARADNDQKILQ